MSFSQLNFGQLLHELNNVDTKHNIRFYEKMKKRILLTNYGIYFNQLYIYINIPQLCLFRVLMVDNFIIFRVQHFFRVQIFLIRVKVDIFITFRVHQAQLQKVLLNENKKGGFQGCPEC